MLGGPLALVWAPVVYIFLSVISLGQFKIALTLLARLIYQKHGGPFWQAIQPTLRQQLTFFESIFGTPTNFTPSATHVLLVAIMIALIAQNRR